jgi:transcriptional regulator with XRE-family HTH domain
MSRTMQAEEIRWFGANLRHARELAGLTQAQLAAAVQRDLGRPFSQQTYSKVESGRQEPGFTVAISLARHTGTDLVILTQAPQQAAAALEVFRDARQLRTAHSRAEVAVTAFWQGRLNLERSLAEAGKAEQTPQLAIAREDAAAALALKPYWEG